MRKTDDRRKIKRAETKERKIREKEEKMQEIKKLQELKKEEVEEKIKKLKEITGNQNLPFENEDLEADFDPAAHDQRMQALFNEEFYQGAEGDQKPEFPELDEYLELGILIKFFYLLYLQVFFTENWEDDVAEEPHCKDVDFNVSIFV